MKVRLATSEKYKDTPAPIPGVQALPDWFKHLRGGPPDARTAKACGPLLDAYSAGYIVRLSKDVYVTDGPTFHWEGEEPIEKHDSRQAPGMPPVFKWLNWWAIEVPEGYSALWTHPLSRVELPFHTFSGMVDYGYNSPVHLPFVWTGDTPVMLERGTPIAQVIPIKIEQWESEIEVVAEEELMEATNKARSIDKGYKKLYRQKKRTK